MVEKNKYIQIATENEQGQRIDNFLIKILKGVPKSRIYKAVRSGEVRINGSRVGASSKINCNDQIRIPPLRSSNRQQYVSLHQDKLGQINTLYEDDHLLVVNKPSGIAVHRGTGLPFGLIEQFRQSRADNKYLELVHRLDRETSGCLILSKDRISLLVMQQQFLHEPRQQKKIIKHYLALVMGKVVKKPQHIRTKLSRIILNSEKRTVVDTQGQLAHSEIKLLRQYKQCALVDVLLITGRTHQARVHCASLEHCIAGDRMYGSHDFNQSMKSFGLSRLFLHAHKLVFEHPISQQEIKIVCPLPEELQSTIDNMGAVDAV